MGYRGMKYAASIIYTRNECCPSILLLVKTVRFSVKDKSEKHFQIRNCRSLDPAKLYNL